MAKESYVLRPRSFLPHNSEINLLPSPVTGINNFQRHSFLYHSHDRADEFFTPSTLCIEDRFSGAVAPFGFSDHGTPLTVLS